MKIYCIFCDNMFESFGESFCPTCLARLRREHRADSPGWVSGRSVCSPAERSGVRGADAPTAGQACAPRRSEAEPGNTTPHRPITGETHG